MLYIQQIQCSTENQNSCLPFHSGLLTYFLCFPPKKSSTRPKTYIASKTIAASNQNLLFHEIFFKDEMLIFGEVRSFCSSPIHVWYIYLLVSKLVDNLFTGLTTYWNRGYNPTTNRQIYPSHEWFGYGMCIYMDIQTPPKHIIHLHHLAKF